MQSGTLPRDPVLEPCGRRRGGPAWGSLSPAVEEAPFLGLSSAAGVSKLVPRATQGT